MRWTIPDLSFIEGVPSEVSDLEDMTDTSIRSLVVLDDFMQELSNDNKITSLFTHS